MALVLNTNVAALNGARNLAKTQDAQSQTFNRLSTGLRINSAKDDAAGLYLAQSQTKDIRGLSMATRNAGDGISMAQTAEGALDQIQSNLQRINELAIQSANGTYSAEARGGLQKEVDQLTQEVNRIVETTEFNGQKLLNKDAKAETLQISFENNAGSRITTGLERGLVAQQGIDNVTFFGAGKDFSGIAPDTSGKTDNAAVKDEFAKTVGLDNSAAAGTLNTAAATDELQKEVNQALKNFQGDADTLDDAIKAKFGFDQSDEITFTAKGMDFTIAVTAGTDAATDSTIDSVKANYAGTDLAFADTNFTAALALDFKEPTVSIGAFAVDAEANVAVFASNALDAIIGGGLSGIKTIDISTQEAAQNSITATRNAIDMVSEIRAEFGANMNRFEAVISGNQTYSENLSAARSRIQDADFAVETSNLAKQQVLQQAGVAALGQANASSQVVLGLL